MADEKGGGKSWEPFEVVLVILLAIGLLTKLQTSSTPSSKSSTHSSTAKKESVTKPTTSACGIQVTRPHPLEQVTTFVTLVGTIEGCDWVPTSSVALYAQVIDGLGRPVSEYVSVPPASADGAGTTFSTSIPLTSAPSAGTGTVILIPAQSGTDTSTTVRIPITFARN